MTEEIVKQRRGRVAAEERLELLKKKHAMLLDELKKQQKLVIERQERKRKEALTRAGEIVEKAGFLDRLDELKKLLGVSDGE
jgi:hypothetical protein